MEQSIQKLSHPLREDVSWNVMFPTGKLGNTCHPLREDVSWNNIVCDISMELVVILFVRMWVEIYSPISTAQNCFGHPLREDVSWNAYLTIMLKHFFVILFVRMWVEIYKPLYVHFSDSSSSSWGCELKCFYTQVYTFLFRHPLREDVSWNVSNRKPHNRMGSHPLREDVSWNSLAHIFL